MGNYGNVFGWGFGGGIMMLVFWIAVIVCIAQSVKEISGKQND